MEIVMPDPIAGDNRAAFQTQLDKLRAAGGGLLQIPAGKKWGVNLLAFTSGGVQYAKVLDVPNNVQIQWDGEIYLLKQTLGMWASSGAYTIVQNQDRGGKAWGIRIFGQGVLNGCSAQQASTNLHFNGI